MDDGRLGCWTRATVKEADLYAPCRKLSVGIKANLGLAGDSGMVMLRGARTKSFGGGGCNGFAGNAFKPLVAICIACLRSTLAPND
jgi:hypothetical protein